MTNLCPKCGHGLNNDGFCETCRVSFQVYDKIKKISKTLFNQGLQLTKVRDLSGAINTLQKSLRYDKNNIESRNLLGLAYFEIGETVLALQQWVISKNLQPTDNLAENYLKNIQENQTHLEKLSSAIKRYNQALQHVQQSNEDLAAIQLKKAISLNPKFIKAYSLLALCYIKDQQIQKAQSTLQKILTIDKNNYIARKYYDSITVNEPVKEADHEHERNVQEDSPFSKRVPIFVTSSWHQIILVAVGVIIGLAVAIFLITPSKLKALKSDNLSLTEQNATYATTLKEKTIALESETAKAQALEQAQGQLKTDLKALQDVQADSSKLLAALQFKTDNDLVNAAEALYSIDATKLEKTAFNEMYVSLKNEVYEKVAVSAYNTGYSLRNSNYEKAIEQFNLSLKLVQNAYYSDKALYYRAVTHTKLAHTEEAKKDFNALITNYPNSNKITDATWQLTQLQ
ncbi:MAG: hypothetical protein CVU84_05550 [Firmicutes bacterium HGW-Firmicutes-1]|jgi:tetratricopeptide (TPR) repeat protein|nr:MAG: hypothetical protein CVU84_05550 [Firmicutes bacterium HGW-Firmicutes-1]